MLKMIKFIICVINRFTKTRPVKCLFVEEINLHSNWLLEPSTLLYLVHQVSWKSDFVSFPDCSLYSLFTSIDKLHHKVEPVLESEACYCLSDCFISSHIIVYGWRCYSVNINSPQIGSRSEVWPEKVASPREPAPSSPPWCTPHHRPLKVFI